MKKIGTRLLTLIMALVMALSCAMFASAADVAEATEENIAVQSNKFEPDMNRSVPNGYGNITGYYSGAAGKDIQIRFNVPDGGAYLYFAYSSEDFQVVSMSTNSGLKVWERFLNPTDGEAKNVQIIFDQSPQDSYWASGTYTLNVDFVYEHYSYAFCVFASPYLLDV